MPDTIHIADLLLPLYRIPSVTAWNRLEASPRTADFGNNLRASVHDPLWMLARQWQFGEFEGEDAASPVTAQIAGNHTTMDRIRFPGNNSFVYDTSRPLETMVEREALTASLFLAVQMGRHFLKLLKAASLQAYIDPLIDEYPISYLIHPNDSDGSQLQQSVQDHLFDGYHLCQATRMPATPPTAFQQWMTAQSIPAPDQQQLMILADKLDAWYRRMYSQPESPSQSKTVQHPFRVFNHSFHHPSASKACRIRVSG